MKLEKTNFTIRMHKYFYNNCEKKMISGLENWPKTQKTSKKSESKLVMSSTIVLLANLLNKFPLYFLFNYTYSKRSKYTYRNIKKQLKKYKNQNYVNIYYILEFNQIIQTDTQN